jgi:NAD(P)-dependent dehydrogenase (short-subunit alcohol dehydrogenase family)
MLTDKVAIITGGGTGIGAATAREFAALGAKVVVSGRRLDKLEAIVNDISDNGGQAMAVAADMADEAQIKALVDATITAYGRIDILHCNAALTDAASHAADGAITDMDAALWDKVMAVNLRGPMLCCKHAIPHILAQGGGSIIITGSGKGTFGDMSEAAYGASKAGLINLTQNLATQYGKQGIRANIVIVGLVLTEGLAENIPPPVQDMLVSHHLTPYLGASEDIAKTVAFLASDDSRFITGHAIYADGGFGAHSPVVADLRRMMAG